jgi:hypothetical protein
LKSRADKIHKVETIISKAVITRHRVTVLKDREARVEIVLKVRADKAETVLETITKVARTVLKGKAAKAETVSETIRVAHKETVRKVRVIVHKARAAETVSATTDQVREQCLLN